MKSPAQHSTHNHFDTWFDVWVWFVFVTACQGPYLCMIVVQALNPPIDPHGIPLSIVGELYILHRTDMELQAYLYGSVISAFCFEPCLPFSRLLTRGSS